MKAKVIKLGSYIKNKFTKEEAIKYTDYFLKATCIKECKDIMYSLDNSRLKLNLHLAKLDLCRHSYNGTKSCHQVIAENIISLSLKN